MHAGIRGAWGSAVAVALLGAVLSAQAPKPAAPPAKPEGPVAAALPDPAAQRSSHSRPRRSGHDRRHRPRRQGQFVANLAKEDFEVLEDGVKQELVTFVLTHGGRVLNDVGAPPPPVQEGHPAAAAAPDQRRGRAASS